ncbi:hypothetical protein MUK42_19061 [Musa troglodytarum]|uniref:Uncharacterized protein n=1 Tax=Musa troglodytarum TaxID=320322 RepID=A0A9E7JHG4_9LILI|nr:hypothetical protein MUK42_19061 [Musa troglodytarum]
MVWKGGRKATGAMGRRRWTEFGSRSVNLYPRRLHPREREEKLEGRWVATSTWGAHHSDVVDVLDEGRREQRERRGGDNGCHGILLLDVNIILGAGDYCAWAAPPVCTQKVWAGRSSLTEVIESPRGEEGNAVKGQLCQQYGRVRARCIAAAAVPLASDFLFFVAAAAALQAHPCDVAGRLVAHHVPQPVARQDQALVALLPIQHPHLRLRNHVRLQITVPCFYDTRMEEGEETADLELTYGSRHGEHAKNPRPVPIDHSTPSGFNPLQLVLSVRLQNLHIIRTITPVAARGLI